MNILAFDTSSKALAVALLRDDNLLAETRITIKKNHSVSLMPTVDFLMRSVDMKPTDLDRVVVAEGPGSYTGLRVAVATAKTLAFALKIDLVGVSSLAALALAVQTEGILVPIMDARRNNVYVGFYRDGESLEADRHAAFDDVLDQLEGVSPLSFVGEITGFAEQIRQRYPQAKQVIVQPSAYEIGKLGRDLPAVDKHSFVPKYLKRVEAEENWLKSQSFLPEDDYIKRV